jgi:WASH complex subunit strumpellin
MDFLSSDCAQTLLRITARGSAIIAELLRLSSNADVFTNKESSNKLQNSDYAQILFDFKYLRDPEECESKINSNTELLDLDQEFHANYDEILSRFYRLFESIWLYQADFSKYIDDVQCGLYIRYSLDIMLQEMTGIQVIYVHHY